MHIFVHEFEMVHDWKNRNKSLAELDSERLLLIDSIKECVFIRDYYTHRNKENENELRRLLHLKESLTYLKDLLLQDLYKCNVNAAKTKRTVNETVELSQEKNYTRKVNPKCLPSSCKFEELVETNGKLISEHQKWREMLINIKQEYSTVYNTLEKNFNINVIKFADEISKMLKDKDSINDN